MKLSNKIIIYILKDIINEIERNQSKNTLDMLFLLNYLNELLLVFRKKKIKYKEIKKQIQNFFIKITLFIKSNFNNPDHVALNLLFLKLARECEPHHPYFFMMPNLVLLQDAFGNQFTDSKYYDFIFSDKGDYIHLKSFFEPLWVMIENGEKPDLIYINKNMIVTHLSENEMNTIISYIPPSKDFFDIVKFKKYQKQDSLLNQLQLLRTGLLKGDVRHEGEELIAASSANIAIVNFKEYFDLLPYDIQIKLKDFKSPYYKEKFEELLNYLFKPLEYAKNNGLIYCVQSIGNKLESIINCNIRMLREMSPDKEYIKLKKLYRTITLFLNVPVLKAIVNDDVAEFKWFVDINQSKNKIHDPVDIKSQNTYLHYCAKYNAINIASFILEKYPTYNKRNKKNETPFFIACKNGHVKIAEKLIKITTYINEKNTTGNAPLHIACYENHIEIVEFLIKNHAFLNYSNNQDETPLYIACFKGYFNIVKLLLDNRANINEWNHYNALASPPIYIATLYGHLDIVKLLIAKKARVNDRINGKTPLYIAVENRNPALVEILIKEGRVDINIFDYMDISPFFLACKNGDVEIVKFILEKDPDINFKCEDKTPLYIASEHGRTDVVKLLLDNKANFNIFSLNDSRLTPLYIAVSNGHAGAVKFLLDAGADIYQIDNNKSLLKTATMHKHIDTIATLVNHHLRYFDARNVYTSLQFMNDINLDLFSKNQKADFFKKITTVFMNHFSEANNSPLEKNIACFEKLLEYLSWSKKNQFIYKNIFKQLKNNILELATQETLTKNQGIKIEKVLRYQRDLIPSLFSTFSMREYHKLLLQNKIAFDQPSHSVPIQQRA